MNEIVEKYARCSLCMDSRLIKENESIGPGQKIIDSSSGMDVICTKCNRGYMQVILFHHWTESQKEEHRKEMIHLNRSNGCRQSAQTRQEMGQKWSFGVRLAAGFAMLKDDFRE